MVRITKSEVAQVVKSRSDVGGMFTETVLYYREFAGLSTDEKPTEGIVTGSLFLEVDTGDVYAFDEVASAWNKIASLGGGN